MAPDATAAAARAPKRSYDSPVRRQRAAETRARIVTAGSRLARALPSWDWTDLTFRAIAEEAGVGQRTVYRHFPSERHLHDAIMKRLEEEAGVSYDGLSLDDVAAVASRVFRALDAFEAAPRPSPRSDTTFDAEDDRRQLALLRAVAEAAPGWNREQVAATAAALDVLWSVPSYHRLTISWGIDPAAADQVIGWLIGLVARSARDGERPLKSPY